MPTVLPYRLRCHLPTTTLPTTIRRDPQLSESAAIRCRDATVRFSGNAEAVSSVTLDIRPGERIAIIGPSGCGKTTLLRSIAGLQVLTSGTIERESAGASRQSTSFVFQQPALLPWRRVLGNVALPLELQKRGNTKADRSRRLQTATEALAEVDLANASNLFPHQLSGGMQMRVSIARALTSQPNLLLLDEPFAALDDILRMQLGDLITRLWRTHDFTMVLVTHNIAEAIELSDRIGIMQRGSLTAVLENPITSENAGSSSSLDRRRTPEFGDFYGVISDRLREVALS